MALAPEWQAPPAPQPRRRRGLLIGGLVAAGLLVLAGGTTVAVGLAHSAAELASASPGTGTGTGSGADDPGRAAPSAPAPAVPDAEPDTFPEDLVDGDCFAFAPGDGEGQGVIGAVHLQSCDDEHEFETFALVPATQPEWPGDDALAAFAEGACTTEFESFVGLPYADSIVEFAYLQPTVDGWAEGERNVLCYAWIEGDTSPGTLEGYGY
nr:septum formation family protein [Frigoribacterium faeni]